MNYGEKSANLCRVCGCKSTGVHYGVLACEGCKAFYKRGLTKSADYKCYFGGVCVVGQSTGGRCKACRFQKCVYVGMNLQATKMGRTPKKKLIRAQEDTGTLGESAAPNNVDEVRSPGIRKIAPAPSAVKTIFHTSSLSAGEGRFTNWKPSHYTPSGGSVTRIFPSTNGSLPDRRPLCISPSSSPLSTVSTCCTSIIDSEIENRMATIEEESESHASIPRTTAGCIAHTDNNNHHHINNNSNHQRTFRAFYTEYPCFVDSFAFLSPNEWNPNLIHDGLNEEILAGLPLFLNQYWGIVQEMKGCVDGTIKSVADAARVNYFDQISMRTALMTQSLESYCARNQPNNTLASMIYNVQAAMEDDVKRQCRFMFSLPGFAELDSSDQRILLVEKFSEIWLMLYSLYYKDDEIYYTFGPENMHCSHFWLSQILEPEYLTIVFNLWKDLSQVGLTQLELFLLLAVAIFQPETTTAKNKATLKFLYSHYLDCLLHLIRSRPDPAERTRTMEQVLKFIRCNFDLLYRLSNYYVRALDFSKLPLRAMRHGSIFTVQDAVSLPIGKDGLLIMSCGGIELATVKCCPNGDCVPNEDLLIKF